MSTKGIVDIVFCLDASGSMSPCFAALSKHISEFIAGLGGNAQMQWDWRIDFVAYGYADRVFRVQSLYYDTPELIGQLYHHEQSGRFFTKDLGEFRSRLKRIEIAGDEATLVALDFCLDYPWRSADRCHRVVVLMTDEPFETGGLQEEQCAVLPALIEKIQQLRVMLYVVAPESAVFDQLSAVDKCVYEVIRQSGKGLAEVNFKQVLQEIGKSVSVSTGQGSHAASVPRGLFGQKDWESCAAKIKGR